MNENIFRESESKSVNTYEAKAIHMEELMPVPDYKKIEIEKSGMKICFLFPSKTEENTEIRKDIKAILSGALREQVERRTH